MALTRRCQNGQSRTKTNWDGLQGPWMVLPGFAASALPLDEIATGPADSLGLGEKYAAHSALDWILQDLKRFPGRGWGFIETGLQSPVTRNRNMALNALLEWPRPSWPEQAPSLLARLRAIEPNQKLRERLQSI
jgi:hypothetical protein